MTDRELLHHLAQVLRPLARAYTNLPAERQTSLQALAEVRVDYLRDAYLALEHYQRHVR